MTQTLQTDIQNNIATITLNRPAKKNAMSFEMMAELVETGKTLANKRLAGRHPDRQWQLLLRGH